MYAIKVIDQTGEHALDIISPSFPYNFEANDIAELANRSSSWSYTIKLPRTPNNEKILGHAGSPFVNTQSPYKRLLCNVYAEGLLIIQRGVLIIDKAHDSTYDIQILSGIANIFEEMKDIPLDNDYFGSSRISLPTYQWKDEDTGVVFPTNLYMSQDGEIQNYHQDGGLFWNTMPIARIGGEDGLLQLILNMMGGYDIITNTPAMDLYRTCMSLVSRKPFLAGSTYLFDRGPDTFPNTTPSTTEQNGRVAATNHPNTRCEIDFSYMPCDRRTSDNHIYAEDAAEYFFNPIYSRPHMNTFGYITLKVYGVGSPMPDAPKTLIGQYYIIHHDSQFELQDYTRIEWDGEVPIKTHIDIGTNTMPLILLEYGFSNHEWTEGGMYEFFNGLPTQDGTDTGSIKLKQSYYLVDGEEDRAYCGQELVPIANLGIKNAQDLFKIICQIFGWTIQIDPVEKTIEAYTFDYIIANKAYAKDWTNKMVMNEDKEIAYEFGKYAKTNSIELAENKMTGYTDKAYFNIPNEKLADTATLASIKVTSGQNNIVELFEKKEDGEYEWKDGSAPHILKVNNDGAIVNHYTAEDIMANYQGIIDTVQKVKVITAKFLLTTHDIINFSPFVPIFLRQYGHYFYVNKISQWESGKTCDVELIQLA